MMETFTDSMPPRGTGMSRAFENYRARILFYCGKLDLRPDGITH